MISIPNKGRKWTRYITSNSLEKYIYVKEYYQKNKEEMQKKGRIKMAKRKNKDIDTLQRIFVRLEDKISKEEVKHNV